MSDNQFIPPPEEQAEEILESLRRRGASVDHLEPGDLVELIDPDKWTWQNLRPVAEAIGAVRPD